MSQEIDFLVMLVLVLADLHGHAKQGKSDMHPHYPFISRG
jgi:hypothetical protein